MTRKSAELKKKIRRFLVLYTYCNTVIAFLFKQKKKRRYRVDFHKNLLIKTQVLDEVSRVITSHDTSMRGMRQIPRLVWLYLTYSIVISKVPTGMEIFYLFSYENKKKIQIIYCSLRTKK